MVITGGVAKGRKVNRPHLKDIRPTSSKMREALFSILGQNLNGMSFWDAFGGSGIMGLEAASRGADPVLITERNSQAKSKIQASANAIGLSVQAKSLTLTPNLKLGSFDVVFFDPPYRDVPMKWFDIGVKHCKGVFVFETAIHHHLPNAPSDWYSRQLKRYGQSQMGIYYKKEDGFGR